MEKFTRQEILERLHKKIAAKEAIIGTSAGLGLVGKIADASGIDLLVGYSTSTLRSDGVPSVAAYRPIFDSNQLTLDLAPRLTKVVKNTPVIMGIAAADPRRDIDKLIDEMVEAGASGIVNAPSSTKHGNPNRRNFDQWGMGFPCEAELIRKCRARNLFSVGEISYIEEDMDAIIAVHGASTVDEMSADEAFHHYLTEIVKAGADMVNVSFELTYDDITEDTKDGIVAKCCGVVQKAIEEAKALNPEIIVTVSGRPFETVDNIRVLLEKTDAHGVIMLDAIEVNAVSSAVYNVVRGFKELSLR